MLGLKLNNISKRAHWRLGLGWTLNQISRNLKGLEIAIWFDARNELVTHFKQLVLCTLTSLKIFWYLEYQNMFKHVQEIPFKCIKMAGIIPCMSPANEKRHYSGMPFLIGWAYTQNDHWKGRWFNSCFRGHSNPWVLVFYLTSYRRLVAHLSLVIIAFADVQAADAAVSSAGTVMTSWHGNAVRITGLCEGNPPSTGGFPSPRASYIDFLCFVWCYPEHAVEQAFELLMIQDAMTLMWCYYNDNAGKKASRVLSWSSIRRWSVDSPHKGPPPAHDSRQVSWDFNKIACALHFKYITVEFCDMIKK